MNFAAGHVYQRLYGGETLVALFVAYSLVNLSYSFFRSSQPFLGLGLTGGLIAAMMPLDKGNFPVHLTGIRQLRYMSLAIFGFTLVKVLMVDLAALDQILRVFILLLLGMVMLGGGYWYIKCAKSLGAGGP